MLTISLHSFFIIFTRIRLNLLVGVGLNSSKSLEAFAFIDKRLFWCFLAASSWFIRVENSPPKLFHVSIIADPQKDSAFNVISGAGRLNN